VTCTHCGRDDAATTPRGLARHMNRCKSNPANATEEASVTDRVRKRADEKLAEVERLVREIARGFGGPTAAQEKAGEAEAALQAHRELVALLGAA
jgi:hypothetical protein